MVIKEKKKKKETQNFHNTYTEFKSHFELPKIVNPIAVSKAK